MPELKLRRCEKGRQDKPLVGGKAQDVSLATVWALLRKGCIKIVSEKYPRIKYKLTKGGRGVMRKRKNDIPKTITWYGKRYYYTGKYYPSMHKAGVGAAYWEGRGYAVKVKEISISGITWFGLYKRKLNIGGKG